MRKLFVAMLLLASSSASAAVTTSQRDGLISLYNSTGGPAWRDGTNWLGAAGTECTWAGVRCNEGETSVIELNLYENNLRGTFPASIGSFALDQGRSLLATATIAREFTLAPNQHLYLDNMVRAIIGNARETSLGELHNLQLAIKVTEGRGSVVPFVVVTDNGTGDTYLRVE